MSERRQRFTEAIRRILRPRSAGRRRAKDERGASASPAVSEYEQPGQRGPDATRDLDAATIRELRIEYAPDPDGRPDPGEIVWTWVPYVEHDGRGKDRPVLLVARIDDTSTAGCYLSTKDHDGFVSIGSGAWDSRGRESFVSLERVLHVHDAGVRREGNVLEAERFARVAEALRGRMG